MQNQALQLKNKEREIDTTYKTKSVVGKQIDELR